MPISATMLDTTDLFFDYLEDFYDDNNYYDDSKPRRKESKFLKYLITETLELKKRKNDEIEDEEIEEIPDDDDETITSTTTVTPLATKQLKRRKTIDFCARSQPYFYTYPTIPILSIRNMRPKSSGANPIHLNSVSIPMLPLTNKKKKSIVPGTPTSYPVISERQQLNAIKVASSKKIEEDSDGGFDDMKLVDLINNEPSSNNNVVDTSFAERIVECLRDLGGKATGAEISNWISDRYDDVTTTKKKLGYTINAVLSSKKHANLFYKETVVIDGNKRALWCLIDEEGAKAVVRRKKSEKSSETEEQILDENSMDANGYKDMEDDDIDRIANSSSSSLVDEIKKKSRSPSPMTTEPTPTDTPLEKSAVDDFNKFFEEDDNTPIVDILKNSLLDDEKSIGKVEVLQQPYRASSDIPSEEIKEEKKTPLSRRRKSSSLLDMDAWIPTEKELKDGEKKEVTSDISPSESEASIEEEEMDEGGEHIDIVDVVAVKKKIKRKVGRPAGKKRSSKGGGGEESFEDVEEEEEDDEETGENEEKPKKKGRKMKRKTSVVTPIAKRVNPAINSNNTSITSTSTSITSASSGSTIHEEEKGESENDTKYEEPDELEGSTYTEMIAHALRSLGGRGTGLEITTFIDENYSGILHNKTVTWRNSVMGCLSANRRNLFSKEPVKQYAKRYVWVLNEDKTKETHNNNSNKKRKSQGTSLDNSFEEVSKEGSKDSISLKEEYPPTTEALPSINGSSNSNSVASSPNPSTEVPSQEFDLENYEDFFDEIEHEEAEDDVNEDDYVDEKQNITPTFTSPGKTKGKTCKNSENNKDYKRADRCDNAVDLITEALKEMGGKATGVQITEWLAVNYKQLGTDKKKLGYTVNAVLSSKKYKGKFVKDKMVQGGSRALWKLASSPKDKQRKN